MINQRLVTNGVIDALRTAVTDKIGDGVAPVDAGQRYATVQAIEGYPEGGVGAPEHCVWLTYRVRSVASDPSNVAGRTSGPRMDAEQLAHLLRTRLLDRTQALSGTGWRVGGRRWVSSATDTEGPTVNVIDDIELMVSPA